jgi:ABC-type Fe3+ transport system permease subunit
LYYLSFSWALGDVSVAALSLPSGATLPLLIQSLLGSYRLEEAAGIACVLLFLGGLTLAIVEGAAYGHGD